MKNENLLMPRVKVESSNIHSVGYDSETMTLQIAFKNGAIYNAHPITADCHKSMMGAESISSFYHAHIRSNENVTVTQIKEKEKNQLMQYDVTPRKFTPTEWRASQLTNQWCCYKVIYPKNPKRFDGLLAAKIFYNEIEHHKANYPNMEFDKVMDGGRAEGKSFTYFILFSLKK